MFTTELKQQNVHTQFGFEEKKIFSLEEPLHSNHSVSYIRTLTAERPTTDAYGECMAGGVAAFDCTLCVICCE